MILCSSVLEQIHFLHQKKIHFSLMSLPELAYRGEVKNVLQTLQSDDV